MRHLPILLGFFALFALVPSAAPGLPLFLSAKVGNATFDASLGDRFQQVLDGDDESWAVGLGYRLGKVWAVLVEYHDLGEVPGFGSPCPQNDDACVEIVVPIEAESEATTVAVQAHWPLLRQRLLLYGKLGAVAWSSDVSEAVDNASGVIEGFDDEGLLLGAGLRVNLPGPFDVFGEVERLADDFEIVQVGVTFGF